MKSDMALFQKTLPFSDPAELPLAFTFDGERYEGIPRSFRPTVRRQTVDACITRYTVEGRHGSGLYVRAEATQYRDFPVTEWTASFTNEAERPLPLLSDIRIPEAVLALPSAELVSAPETAQDAPGAPFVRTPLTAPFSVSAADGTAPYFRLAGAQDGLNLAVGWPGQWSASFAPAEGGIRVSVGQERCSMVLLPGESVRTPSVTLMAYAGEEEHGRNLWRKWYFAHILPRENGQPLSPKLCLHGTDGAQNPAADGGLSRYLARGMRPDLWEGGIRAGHTQDGKEKPAAERVMRELSAAGALCEEQDIRFLLRLSREPVRRSAFWDAHPAWLLRSADGEEALLNLGDVSCCDAVIAHVGDLLESARVTVCREDRDFDPAPFFAANEAPDRCGALENFYVQGLLRYWDALLDARPGLLLETTAFGGRGCDIETLRRAVSLRPSDASCGSAVSAQRRHSFLFAWIPYFCGSNQSGADCFAYHCAMTPALAEQTREDAPDEDFDLASVMHPIWRRAAEIELRAEFYPLSPCRGDARDWYAVQFDDPQAGDGFLQLIRNPQAEDDTFFVQMKTHDPDAVYFFENMETGDIMQLTGEQLMTGFPAALSAGEGVIWFYHIVTF